MTVWLAYAHDKMDKEQQKYAMGLQGKLACFKSKSGVRIAYQDSLEFKEVLLFFYNLGIFMVPINHSRKTLLFLVFSNREKS